VRYTGAIWLSAWAAAIFAVHPMHVESVAWIAERKNVLSTFFWILTMLFYVAYVRNPDWKRYALVVVSFTLGLLSKPMLVTLPFVLLLMDYWPLNRTFFNPAMEAGSPFAFPANRKKLSWLVIEKVPLFVLIVFSIYMTIHASKHARSVQDMATWSVVEGVFNAMRAYVVYIKKMFWPVNLSIFYPITNVTAVQISISILILMVITVFALRYARKYPFCFVGWLWFVGTLVPVIGIYQVGLQAMADRYAYVSFIGLFIMVTWSAYAIAQNQLILKRTFLFGFVVSVLFLSGIASHRISQWADTETLFKDAVQKDLDNYIAYQVLAQEMDKKGNYQEALTHYEKTISIHPQCWQAFNNKGLILKKMGRRQDAFESFQRAVDIYPYAAEAYHNMGVLCFEEKKFEQAADYFLKSIDIKPEFIESYNYLGVALAQSGKLQEAIQSFRQALKINPNDEDARKNLKIALDLQVKK